MTNDATVRSPIVHTQSLSSSHICIAGQPDSAANTASKPNHKTTTKFSRSLSLFLRLFLPSNHKKRKENDYLSLCVNVLRVKDASYTGNGTVSQHACPSPTKKGGKKNANSLFYCIIPFPHANLPRSFIIAHIFWGISRCSINVNGNA